MLSTSSVSPPGSSSVEEDSIFPPSSIQPINWAGVRLSCAGYGWDGPTKASSSFLEPAHHEGRG